MEANTCRPTLPPCRRAPPEEASSPRPPKKRAAPFGPASLLLMSVCHFDGSTKSSGGEERRGPRIRALIREVKLQEDEGRGPEAH
ncbi:hypothetical protein EYF80_048057 [Liparis tanakae]|uniref:Uncharacterized protein n=1 Tax=Liparis tanakae TaxID=230148 RepID=A0A4Z2FKK1_9TELE|nr:hypothetical protein EYF80_048057 [Liparis tanakae]